MVNIQEARQRLAHLYIQRSSLDRKIADLEHLIQPRRRPVAACGTDNGYYRHVRVLREPACRACKNAHADAERTRKNKRKQKQT